MSEVLQTAFPFSTWKPRHCSWPQLDCWSPIYNFIAMLTFNPDIPLQMFDKLQHLRCLFLSDSFFTFLWRHLRHRWWKNIRVRGMTFRERSVCVSWCQHGISGPINGMLPVLSWSRNDRELLWKGSCCFFVVAWLPVILPQFGVCSCEKTGPSPL